MHRSDTQVIMGVSLSRAGAGVSSFYLTWGSFAPSGTSFLESFFPSRSTTDRQLNIIPWKRLIKRSLTTKEEEEEGDGERMSNDVLEARDDEQDRLNSVLLAKILDSKVLSS